MPSNCSPAVVPRILSPNAASRSCSCCAIHISAQPLPSSSSSRFHRRVFQRHAIRSLLLDGSEKKSTAIRYISEAAVAARSAPFSPIKIKFTYRVGDLLASIRGDTRLMDREHAQTTRNALKKGKKESRYMVARARTVIQDDRSARADSLLMSCPR